MDLRIKDVADLLNVSETTVRRWLADGEIPAYRFGNQYRFSRPEIEHWMMGRKIKQPSGEFLPLDEEKNPPADVEQDVATNRSGLQQFSLYRAIHQGGVFLDLAAKTKEEAIRQTMVRVAPKLNLDPEVLAELLLDREKLVPTALNHGVAVPHPRDFLLKSPFDLVTVVFPKEPIEYGALDGKPVHTLFFLFSPTDKRHLHLLAKIAHFSSNSAALELLRSRPSGEELLEFVRDWESTLNS
jgi:PTS system nitrogen regulatory IIA component